MIGIVPILWMITVSYFGDTEHLFDYTASKDDVLNFTEYVPLNTVSLFCQQFGCEPMGIDIKSNVKIIY